MSEKSRPKITIFNKMIALSSIRKPPPAAAMVKLRRLVYFVDNYNHAKLRLFPHFKNKTVCIRIVCQFKYHLNKIQIFSLI